MVSTAELTVLVTSKDPELLDRSLKSFPTLHISSNLLSTLQMAREKQFDVFLVDTYFGQQDIQMFVSIVQVEHPEATVVVTDDFPWAKEIGVDIPRHFTKAMVEERLGKSEDNTEGVDRGRTIIMFGPEHLVQGFLKHYPKQDKLKKLDQPEGSLQFHTKTIGSLPDSWGVDLKTISGFVLLVDSARTESSPNKMQKDINATVQAIKGSSSASAPFLFLVNLKEEPTDRTTKFQVPSSIFTELNLAHTLFGQANNNFYLLLISLEAGIGFNEAYEWLQKKTNRSSQPTEDKFSFILIFNDKKQVVTKLTKNQGVIPIKEIESKLDDIQSKTSDFYTDTSTGMQLLYLNQSNYWMVAGGDFQRKTSTHRQLRVLLDKVVNLMVVLSGKDQQFEWLVRNDFPEFFKATNRAQSHKDNLIGVVIAIWDEDLGPKTIDDYKREAFDQNEIAMACFIATTSIYGHHGSIEPCFVTLPIKHQRLEARVFIDSYKDEDVRGGQRMFLVITLYPDITGVDLREHDKLVANFGREFAQHSSGGAKKLAEDLAGM